MQTFESIATGDFNHYKITEKCSVPQVLHDLIDRERKNKIIDEHAWLAAERCAPLLVGSWLVVEE